MNMMFFYRGTKYFLDRVFVRLTSLKLFILIWVVYVSCDNVEDNGTETSLSKIYNIQPDALSIEEVPVVKLDLINSISSINDSIFIRISMDIVSTSDLIYINDAANSRVIVTDTDYNLVHIVGREGKGPGETIKGRFMSVSNGVLYFEDSGSRRINMYDNTGQFLNEIKIPEEDRIMTQFTVADGTIYVSNNINDFSINGFNQEGVKYRFGGNFDHLEESEKYSRNERNLVVTDNKLISVGISEPILEVFSLSGEKLFKCDFMNDPIFEHTLHIIEKKRSSSPYRNKTTFHVIPMIKYYKDKLFMLKLDHLTMDQYNKDKILVMDLKEGICSPKLLLDLAPAVSNDKRAFTSFCIYDGGRKLVGFDVKSGDLLVFSLENIGIYE